MIKILDIIGQENINEQVEENVFFRNHFVLLTCGIIIIKLTLYELCAKH